MQVVYAREALPPQLAKSIFLAGPTPRSNEVASWRPEAVHVLSQLGYDGVVFVPENRSREAAYDYVSQVSWEETCLNAADCIVFWLARNNTTMLALTTNSEWGVWHTTGKAVLGTPEGAFRVSYQEHQARDQNIPLCHTLEETLSAAIKLIGAGSLRVKGEVRIPLIVWNTPMFQSWYKFQKANSNEICDARVRWTFKAKEMAFFWALWVDILITSEGRHKTNELVISRPDISITVLYCKKGDNIMSTEVVLVREYRVCARNPASLVWELPGGSSFDCSHTPLKVAVDECVEETGFSVESSRLVYHGSRQLMATMSTHHAHVFSTALNQTEMDSIKQTATTTTHGVTSDTECTTVVVTTLGEVMKGTSVHVDWSTLGVLTQVLLS